ncbi:MULTISPECIES: CobW family GTP-binding protein [Roseobacteraceae]|jgi:Ni2+-binding GTPase involved in maturation of urease and hydrogenase|uniref:Putative metal chaperone YciC n=1 Tax=Pseudosulfitobacter pseudonitzschiae TaxID=1402135 RepID=A0A221K1W9_9RHOB|nr:MULTISPECIES: CobW family GTP-binding protein [Roseobacteraceae]ASM72903.1 putative metal chaperone YciC [Pseudosulfitobacter pseudonitzschiae]
MNRLPLTVIGGYLGAGKTTLINRLLAEDHGQRVLVMVNDFGAINIDAALIARQSEGMVELSNGCVCCTMGGDLFMAIGDVLDRNPRPDHLVIEASGVADPAAIAQVALAEPDLSYGGVAVVVDALAYDNLMHDPQIGAQLRAQVDVADALLVTKGNVPDSLGPRDVPVIELSAIEAVAPLLLGAPLGEGPRTVGQVHPDYVAWQYRGGVQLDRTALIKKLDARPKGLMRVKGFVMAPDGRSFEVHCVGGQHSLKPAQGVTETLLVAIGLKGRVVRAEIAAWWNA